MSIDTLTDISSLVDMESEQQCSLQYIVNRRPFCIKPAEWAAQLSCCGHIKLVCTDHQNIVMSVFPKVFVCTRCRTPQPSVAATWAV
jgi:hypothetical protein